MTIPGGFSGAISPQKCAVVVIDLQNDFCDPKGAWAKVGVDPDLSVRLDCIWGFIKEAHARKVPVLFLRTVFTPWTISPAIRRWWDRVGVGSFCLEGSWGAEFFKILPQQQDRIVNKYRASGFIETDFDLTLRAKKVESLLFTGVGVWGGLFETARDALAKNYDVVLLEDCVGGGLPDERSTLLGYSRRYGQPVASSTDIVSEWSK